TRAGRGAREAVAARRSTKSSTRQPICGVIATMDSLGRPDWAGRLRVRQFELAASNLDGFVVSAAPNIRYLTGFDGSAGTLVISRHESILISDGRYALTIQEGIRAGTLAPVSFEQVSSRYDLTLVDVVKSRGFRRLGFEAAHV